MAEAARKSWWKIAILAVVAIEIFGGLSGWLSNSGFGNPWFDSLIKPTFMSEASWSCRSRASLSVSCASSRRAGAIGCGKSGLIIA